MHCSFQAPPSIAPSSILNTLPPQTPLNGIGPQHTGSLATLPPQTPIMNGSSPYILQPPQNANNLSTASTLQLGVSTVQLPQQQHQAPMVPPHSNFSQQQQQPLPPAPPPHADDARLLPPSASSASLAGSAAMLPKRVETPPVHRPLEPMGLPKSQGPLVPGRMSTGGGGGGSRPPSRSGSRRDFPSTAV